MRSENSNQSNEFYEKLNSVGEQVKVIEKSIRYLFNPLFHHRVVAGSIIFKRKLTRFMLIVLCHVTGVYRFSGFAPKMTN